MPWLHDYPVLATLVEYWHYFGIGLTLLTVLLTAWKIQSDFRKGRNFIATVLEENGDGRRRASRLMLGAFWRAKTLFIDFGARRLAAARYITELEILLPALSEPKESDYSAEDFHGVHAEWKRQSGARAALKRHLFAEHFASRRLTVLSWIWAQLRARLLGANANEEDPGSIIPITDIPGLDDSRTLIKRYFETLDDKLKNESKAFISVAEFKTGYLAPMFLVTGLINRFGEEEGWKLILDNYRRLVQDDVRAYSRELVELRSFLFNCWLLWGPSISPCACTAWGNASPQDPLILQYGYGDENNSIDVLIRNGRNPAKIRTINLTLNPMGQRDAPFNPIATMGAPFVVRGTFNWGPALGATVPDAQRLVQGGMLLQSSANGRIILECDATGVEAAAPADAPNYYSAYIWIMFRLETPEGQSFFPEARWKDLLVFFEHGNIADPTTFQTLKESLAAKTCSALTELLEREADRGKVCVRYICALDHSYCGPKCDVLFPAQEGLLGRSAQPSAMRSTRTIEIMADAVKRLPDDHVLRSKRVMLPSTLLPPEDNAFSSCHLPLMVEEFYRDLRRVGLAKLTV